MFSVEFEDKETVTYASFEEVIEHVQNSDFYSSAGIIKDIYAKLVDSTEMFVCSCNKIHDISIAMPYSFNSDVFAFDGEAVGDTIEIDKFDFDESCLQMDLEIIAKDSEGQYYVSESVVQCCSMFY